MYAGIGCSKVLLLILCDMALGFSESIPGIGNGLWFVPYRTNQSPFPMPVCVYYCRTYYKAVRMGAHGCSKIRKNQNPRSKDSVKGSKDSVKGCQLKKVAET